MRVPYLEVHGQFFSGIIRSLIWAITIVILLISPLITTHEPPSRIPKPQVWNEVPDFPRGDVVARISDRPG